MIESLQQLPEWVQDVFRRAEAEGREGGAYDRRLARAQELLQANPALRPYEVAGIVGALIESSETAGKYHNPAWNSNGCYAWCSCPDHRQAPSGLCKHLMLVALAWAQNGTETELTTADYAKRYAVRRVHGTDDLGAHARRTTKRDRPIRKGAGSDAFGNPEVAPASSPDDDRGKVTPVTEANNTKGEREMAGYLRLENGQAVEVEFRNLQAKQVATHWVDDESRECEGPSCSYCKAGRRPRTKYVFSVWQNGNEFIWEVGKRGYDAVVAAAKATGLPAYKAMIVRMGEGLQTTYDIRDVRPLTNKPGEEPVASTQAGGEKSSGPPQNGGWNGEGDRLIYIASLVRLLEQEIEEVMDKLSEDEQYILKALLRGLRNAGA